MNTGTGAVIGQASIYMLEGSRLGSKQLTRFLGQTDDRGLCDVGQRITIPDDDTVAIALSPDGVGVLSLASGDRTASEREFVISVDACGDFAFQVSDERGAPLEGAIVRASPAFYPLGPLGSTAAPCGLSERCGDGGRLRARFEAHTDAKGYAILHGVPGAENSTGYSLSVEKEGYCASIVHNQQPDAHAEVKRDFTLLRVRPLATLEGTVRCEDGSHLPPTTVRYGERTSIADPLSGHYELSECDRSTSEIRYVSATAQGWASDKVLLPANASDKVVKDLTLFRVGSICGVILDDCGHPVSRARVMARENTDEARRRMRVVSGTPPLTLTDGRFAFPDLRSGEYELIVQLEDRRVPTFAGPLPTLRFPRVLASTGDSSVQISAERESAVLGSVHARVVDARTRAPIDIVAAAVMSPTGLQANQSPRPASFSIRIGEIEIPQVPTGKWGLWVLATGGATGFTSFETTTSTPSALVEVRVCESSTMSGHIVAAEGTMGPASWEGVSVIGTPTDEWTAPPGSRWWEAAPQAREALARADGSFSISGVVPGRYLVQVRDSRFIGSMTVEITDSAPSPIELKVREPGPATIIIHAQIELLDGLTMLRYSQGGQFQQELRLKADVSGQDSCTLPASPGDVRIQVWRRPNGADVVEPTSFILDECFELNANETHILVVPPR